MEKVTSSLSATTISGAELASKRPAGTRGTAYPVKTNLAKIDLKPNQPFYKYDVEVFANIVKRDGTMLAKEISKPCRDDTNSQMRKGACVLVHKEVIKKNASFFGKSDTFYDRCKILFSLQDFKLTGTKTFTVSFSSNPVCYEDAKDFTMNIKSCADSFNVTTNDLSKAVNSRVDQKDTTILEALNLVCSHKAFNSPDQFISYGQGTHFLFNPFHDNWFRPADLPELPDGKYMGVAVCKKVSVLEGENKKPTAYLSTEIKKTGFHQDHQPLLEKLGCYDFVRDRDAGSFNRAIRQYKSVLKGLMVYAKYNQKSCFPIMDLTERSARDTRFELPDGKTVTVADYMTRSKGVNITMPTLFMVVVNQRGQQSFYPVEALLVAPNQRVIQSQATPKENEVAIKASATLPANRLRQTETMKKKAMDFNSTNQQLLAAGLKVDDNLAVVKGRVLPTPSMQYAKKGVAAQEGCKWKNDSQFYGAMKLTNWMVVGHFAQRDANRLDVNAFIGEYTRTMTRFGMQASKPIVKSTGGMRNQLEAIIAEAAHQKIELIVFVSSDSLKDHDEIKRLELKHQVLTQDLKLTTIAKCIERGQPQTWENIVNKTNLKLGGFNFQVNMGTAAEVNTVGKWINDPTRLFFGLEMSHPAALTKSEEARHGYSRPSVLGYACNTGKHPQQYIGDYLYVEPRSTEPMGQSIEKIVPECLKAARASRNVMPAHLVFLIHGVSEGQYGEIATTYAKYVRKGLDSLSTSLNPKVTFIAVSKEHNERLYPQTIKGEKAAQQNVNPGTVVDSVIVNPALNEFYLQSHQAFQGTGKAPKYTVVLDSAGMPMDVIQGMMHGLCFLHEIVSMTVSMPAPLMVANRCAKRGNKNFNAEHTSNSTVGSMDFAQLNAELTNSNKKLSKVRYNA